MPKKLGLLLNELFTKAGIKADDPGLLAIVQNGEIFKMDVPDELATAIEGGLHTLDSAKAKLKSQLFSEAYNGMDTEFTRLMDEEGFDDTTKSEFKINSVDGKIPQGSSTKRAVAIAKKMKELAAKASKSTGPEKQELIDKINSLNAEKANLVKAHNDELEKIKSDAEQQLMGVEISSMLGNYNYGLGDIEQPVKLLTAKNILESAMMKDGVKIVRKDGALQLVTKDGSDYFDKSNNKKDLKSYIEGAISGILKASDDPGGGSNRQHTIVKKDTPVITPGDQATISKIEAQLAEIKD